MQSVCLSLRLPGGLEGRQGGGLGRSIPEDKAAFKEENADGGVAPRVAPEAAVADGMSRKDGSLVSLMVRRWLHLYRTYEASFENLTTALRVARSRAIPISIPPCVKLTLSFAPEYTIRHVLRTVRL